MCFVLGHILRPHIFLTDVHADDIIREITSREGSGKLANAASTDILWEDPH